MALTGTLWAALILATGAYVPPRVYTVREGDSFSVIAARTGVPTYALRQANREVQEHRIQVGSPLRIPGVFKRPLHANLAPTSAPERPVAAANAGHVVRNGENDWTIARRFNIKPSELRAMNPGVDWRRLQVGQRLAVPGSAPATAQVARAAPSRPARATTYTVRQGDNDWVIASRHGIRPSDLRAANPGVRWTSLQIGQQLNLPGGATRVASAERPRTIVGRARTVRDGVIIRRGPSTNSARITQVERGTVATVLGRRDGWYQLRFSRGTVGWVRADLLAQAPSGGSRVAGNGRGQRAAADTAARPRISNAGSAASLLGTARSLLGTRYRWGGTTSRGMDCSGFTQTVFRKHGVRIPRTSASQATVGVPVSKRDLQKGDLVFFRTRGNRISHVGIYVGSGKFMHASTTRGRVRTDTLRSGYYASRWAGGRRVLVNSAAARSAAATPAPKAAQQAPAQAPQATTPPPQQKAVEPPPAQGQNAGEAQAVPPPAGTPPPVTDPPPPPPASPPPTTPPPTGGTSGT